MLHTNDTTRTKTENPRKICLHNPWHLNEPFVSNTWNHGRLTVPFSTASFHIFAGPSLTCRSIIHPAPPGHPVKSNDRWTRNYTCYNDDSVYPGRSNFARILFEELLGLWSFYLMPRPGILGLRCLCNVFRFKFLNVRPNVCETEIRLVNYCWWACFGLRSANKDTSQECFRLQSD